MNNLKLIIMIFGSLFSGGCNSQENNSQTPLINRDAVFAGQFYPGTEKSLSNTLDTLFLKALPKQSENILAIISPHAGYVYSGEVAATSFNQINPEKKYERIFILAPSHRTSLKGASIYSIGNYETPLGIVKVDINLAKELIEKHDCFEFNNSAHNHEHSLEVQLPFLQHKMKTDFMIVPIVIGSFNQSSYQEIAKALKPYFNEKNLFVISTDFSHFPSYNDAVTADNRCANAITTNSVKELQKAIVENDDSKYPGLSTSMCGSGPVFTLLYMTEEDPDFTITALQYKNSGDADFGDKSRVVGYYSLVVTQKGSTANEAEYNLSDNEKELLLKIARNTIVEYLKTGKAPVIKRSTLTENLMKNCGCFVTLKKNGKLRGCIGRFIADESLYIIVQKMAVASATEDSRFMPVTSDEIDNLEIEISVLTPLKKINSIDEIVLGKHGIYIKKGWKTGTYLPQVADETTWNVEEFVSHCSHDKAGIGWDGWKSAELFTYEALVFSEEGFLD